MSTPSPATPPPTPTPPPAPTGTALAPLRARYASWLELDVSSVVADREEDPDRIRALQLLLRLERSASPSWHRAVELAATACAALCLDPRSEPGGEWFDAVADYCAGHIRKVTRRGRGAQWAATADLPGISLGDGDTEIRALVPGLVSELDKRVSKLQVGGTDMELDEPGDDPAPAGALELWVPTEPVMTVGKQMAQAGHAGMIAAALLAQDDPTGLATWSAAGCPARVRCLEPADYDELLHLVATPEKAWRTDRLLAVRDAGFTEIAPGTVTVIARAPNSG